MEKKAEFIELNDYFENHINGQYWGRLGKTFKNRVGYYFYDTGTNRVAKIEKNTFITLKNLLENNGNFESLLGCADISLTDLLSELNFLKDCIETNHILSAPPYEGMENVTLEDLSLNYHSMQNLTLEVTEDCNFRCKYCVYNEDHPDYRGFSKSKMSWDIGKKAIDFFMKNSDKNELVYIGFYGGEPLMNYPLIKKSIKYLKENYSNREISYSMTTNGSLINQEVANYLVENDFVVTVSIDGPKEIHDENRVFSNGNGTFETAIRGIKNLEEATKKQGKERENISFNMVNASEDREDNYSAMNKLYEEMGWQEKTYPMTTTIVDKGPIKSRYILPQSKEDVLITSISEDPLEQWFMKTKRETAYEPTFADSTVNSGLLGIHNRQITDIPLNNPGYNACCMPGQRRLYVKVDGNFLPCEKVGGSPIMGNVESGMDLNSIKKHYFDDFSRQAFEFCKNCWALNLCGQCYVGCFNEGLCDLNYRHAGCLSERYFIESNLRTYHELIEKNPEHILALNDIIVT